MLGVTSQTLFTYFAYAKDLNFAQGGWGKNLDGWRDGWVGERAGGPTDRWNYLHYKKILNKKLLSTNAVP